jgi:hypothetical protein
MNIHIHTNTKTNKKPNSLVQRFSLLKSSVLVKVKEKNKNKNKICMYVCIYIYIHIETNSYNI